MNVSDTWLRLPYCELFDLADCDVLEWGAMNIGVAPLVLMAISIIPRASLGLLVSPIAPSPHRSSGQKGWYGITDSNLTPTQLWGSASIFKTALTCTPSKKKDLAAFSSCTNNNNNNNNNNDSQRRRVSLLAAPSSSPSASGSWRDGVKYLSTLFHRSTKHAAYSVFQASSAQNDIVKCLKGGLWTGGGSNGTDPSGALGSREDAGGGGHRGVELGGEHSQRDGRGKHPVLNFLPVPMRPVPWLWISALWGLYVAWLGKFPLVTKAVTAGVLAFIGDAIAQAFEFQQSDRKGPRVKDTRRLLAVVIDGAFITAPALHALYGMLEYWIPTTGGEMFPALCHLLVDTLVFDPMFVASFFCVTGMLENRALFSDVLPSLRREFWPTMRGAWAVDALFGPLNYVTFRYLPLEFRVLSVNICDIVWTSVLSYFSHKHAIGTAARETPAVVGEIGVCGRSRGKQPSTSKAGVRPKSATRMFREWVRNWCTHVPLFGTIF